MWLKGALHVHTRCSDGRMSIAEAVTRYEGLGFDFIALTDHDFLITADCYAAVPRLRTSLLIFTGVELTLFARGYVHVNRVMGEQEVLHIFNHPAELGLPPHRVAERVQEIARQAPLDAIEITSRGFVTPEFDIPEISYPRVATDDAHTLEMCGRAWVEMDCRRDKDAIIQAIRQGDFWNCYA